MKWFEYVSDDNLPSHLDILTSARRRVFSTENPKLIRKCLALKGAHLMAGDPEHGFRLTRSGHDLLKGKP